MDIDYKKYQKKLDEVSPSFCKAKWTSCYIYLQNFQTGSCYHPLPHNIDKNELKKNIHAFHNTKTKIQARKEMLNGIRPEECDYCWIAENNNSISDRAIQSYDFEKFSDFEYSLSDQIKPKLVEVILDNTCNFHCMYCNSNLSSKWQQILNEPVSKTSDENIELFLKWFESIRNDLYRLKFSGGETLLSKNFHRFIDNITEKQSYKLTVDTNLCVPEKNWQNFLSKIKYFPKVHVCCSLDAIGEYAKYTRPEYNEEMFWTRIKELQAYKTLIPIQLTINAVNFFYFIPLLDRILEYRKDYKDIIFYINIVTNPDWQNVEILPYDIRSAQTKNIQIWLDKNKDYLNNDEIEFVKRLVNHSNRDTFDKTKFEKLKSYLDWYYTTVSFTPKRIF